MKKRVLKSLSLKAQPNKRLGLFVSRHRKPIIIGGIVLLVLVVIGSYVWWSLSNWTAVTSRSAALQQSVHNKFDSALSISSQDKAKKLAAFTAVGQEITSKQGICDTPRLVNWQHNLEMFKIRENDCRADIVRLNTLNTRLSDITNYLHDEQVLAGLIVTASGGQAEIDEANLPEAANKWHTLSDKLKTLKVSSGFEAVLKRTITEVSHMDACWQEVIAGHTAKDRTRFEKAKDELSKAYGSFKDIVQLDNATSAPIIKQLETAYTGLTF